MKLFTYPAETVIPWIHLLFTALAAVLLISIKGQTRQEKFRNLFFTFVLSATVALAALYSLKLVFAFYCMVTVFFFVLWRRAPREERDSQLSGHLPQTRELQSPEDHATLTLNRRPHRHVRLIGDGGS